MPTLREAIYQEAQTLPQDALRELLAMAIKMLAVRGAATPEQLSILQQLEGADMSVQLSFDGQYNREVDPLASLLSEVRRAEVDGELWLSAVELANAAKGGSPAPRQYWHSVKRRIEEEDEMKFDESSHILRIVQIPDALGRMQNNDMLNEQGCYRVLMAIPGRPAARVRKWMTQQLKEYRQSKGTSEVRIPGTSLARQALAMAQALVDHEDRIRRLEELMIVKQDEAETPLLPAPTVDAPQKPTRASVNQLIRNAAHRRGTPHSFLWKALYREFTYRTGHDVGRIAKNRDVEIIGVVEELNLMEELHAIAYEMYGEG